MIGKAASPGEGHLGADDLEVLDEAGNVLDPNSSEGKRRRLMLQLKAKVREEREGGEEARRGAEGGGAQQAAGAGP